MKRSMSGKTEPCSVFKASGLSGLNTTYTLWTELNPANDHGVQAQWAHSLRSKVTDHLVCHRHYFKVLHFTCGQVHVSINRCHISCFLTVLISHDLGNPKIYYKLQSISAGYSVFPSLESIIVTSFQSRVKALIQRGLSVHELHGKIHKWLFCHL